jgi:hypothetical protein
MKKFNVKFSACGSGTDKETNVRALDEKDALEKAVTKLYGKKASWWANYELPGYGQVMKYIPSAHASSSITDRVGVSVIKKSIK